MAETAAARNILPSGRNRRRAIAFVVLVGAMSFFADFTYEGSRSIVGPYLGLLGASAAAIGIVAGLGELLGYGLRVVSGRLSDRTGQYWPITIVGYVVQMSAVPLLALAGSWQVAAALVVLERVGKATRNPPRDVMLSHAGQEIGQGWAFGVHEALDQSGALFGPLLAAGVLALRGDYRAAFALLAVPALLTLGILVAARLRYPRPEEIDHTPPDLETRGLPRRFFLYLAGAALVAAGFVDFPLVAYHFSLTSSVPAEYIPVFYAVAMGAGGLASLVFGRLFDRLGLGILVPLTVVTAAFAPLVFLGGFWPALVGMALWGVGIGVHESIIPAAVAPMVPAQRRASAYGLFTAGYGVAWFIGSAAIGLLYARSVPVVIALSVALELAAVPIFLIVRSRVPRTIRVP